MWGWNVWSFRSAHSRCTVLPSTLCIVIAKLTSTPWHMLFTSVSPEFAVTNVLSWFPLLLLPMGITTSPSMRDNPENSFGSLPSTGTLMYWGGYRRYMSSPGFACCIRSVTCSRFSCRSRINEWYVTCVPFERLRLQQMFWINIAGAPTTK